MIITRFTKAFLGVACLINGLLYGAIKFKVVLIHNVTNWETWNSIGENVTLTLATSLGFWFVTEWVSSLFSKSDTRKLEREFLDEALYCYNRYVHSLTAVHPSRPKKLPNYVETHDIKKIGAMVGKWQVMFAEHHALNVDNCFRPDGTYRNIKGIVKEIKRVRKEYVPYEAQFSKAFNKKYHEAIHMMDFFISLHEKRDHETAMSLLASIREQLIQLVNLWRGKNNKKEIEGEGRVFIVEIPDPPTRWKLPWMRKKVIRIQLADDVK